MIGQKFAFLIQGVLSYQILGVSKTTRRLVLTQKNCEGSDKLIQNTNSFTPGVVRYDSNQKLFKAL